MKALYSHTIQLIEPTKLLERNICDTMTVTNSLGHDFSDIGAVVRPNENATSATNIYGYITYNNIFRHTTKGRRSHIPYKV